MQPAPSHLPASQMPWPWPWPWVVGGGWSISRHSPTTLAYNFRSRHGHAYNSLQQELFFPYPPRFPWRPWAGLRTSSWRETNSDKPLEALRTGQHPRAAECIGNGLLASSFRSISISQLRTLWLTSGFSAREGTDQAFEHPLLASNIVVATVAPSEESLATIPCPRQAAIRPELCAHLHWRGLLRLLSRVCRPYAA
jgi:hypothetical protein